MIGATHKFSQQLHEYPGPRCKGQETRPTSTPSTKVESQDLNLQSVPSTARDLNYPSAKKLSASSLPFQYAIDLLRVIPTRELIFMFIVWYKYG